MFLKMARVVGLIDYFTILPERWINGRLSDSWSWIQFSNAVFDVDGLGLEGKLG